MNMPNEYDHLPAGQEFFKPAEHINELLDIEYVRYLDNYRTSLTKPGEEGGAECHIRVLDGASKGVYYKDQVVVQTALRARLKQLAPGRHTLARVIVGNAKPGQNPPFLFADYTEDDLGIARRFYADMAAGNLPDAPAQNDNGKAETEDEEFKRWQAERRAAREARQAGTLPNNPPF